jgi:hypothetical protein
MEHEALRLVSRCRGGKQTLVCDGRIVVATSGVCVCATATTVDSAAYNVNGFASRRTLRFSITTISGDRAYNPSTVLDKQRWRRTMPRGRRRSTPDVNSLESELTRLRQRQAELRQQIRRARNSEGEVRKLEEKLTKQLSGAKWTADQIKQLQPNWDDLDFYRSVPARQPTPRGRRRRSTGDGNAS